MLAADNERPTYLGIDMLDLHRPAPAVVSDSEDLSAMVSKRVDEGSLVLNDDAVGETITLKQAVLSWRQCGARSTQEHLARIWRSVSHGSYADAGKARTTAY